MQLCGGVVSLPWPCKQREQVSLRERFKQLPANQEHHQSVQTLGVTD
jgi:hypothetical protein